MTPETESELRKLAEEYAVRATGRYTKGSAIDDAFIAGWAARGRKDARVLIAHATLEGDYSLNTDLTENSRQTHKHAMRVVYAAVDAIRALDASSGPGAQEST